MTGMKKVIDVAMKLICVAFLTGIVFLSSHNFNDAYLQPKYYTFIIGTAFFALALLFRLWRRPSIGYDIITILLCALCAYITARGLLSHTTYQLIFVPACLALYFVLRSFDNYTRFLNTTIVALCIAESILGILQFTGVVPTQRPYYVIGSFDNPAGIASFLALCLPFCIWIARDKGIVRYIGIGGGILAIATILLTQSRAGIFAVAVVALLFAVSQYGDRIRRSKWIKAGICIGAVILLAGMYLAKKDSASGRVLIWTVSTQMAKEAPVFGQGTGSFRKGYMQHQEQYFELHPDSKFARYADNTQYAFNEYLKLAVEYGIVAVVIALFLIVAVFKKGGIKNNYHIMVLFIS